MSAQFRMPDLGEGIGEAEVLRWLVRVGQRVEEDEPLLEVQTDKAIMEIPSPYTGTVVDILVGEGRTVAVGTPLVLVEGSEVLADASEERSPVAELSSFASHDGDRMERLSFESNGDDRNGARVERLTGLRRLAAEHVTRAHREIPAVTIVDQCDFSDVPRIGLSYLPSVLRAAALGLRDQPLLNALMVDGELRVEQEINIGIAVQSPDGLLVPVLRGVDHLEVQEIASRVRDLIQRARDHALRPEELRGSTFTVTAAGRRGGLFATPLINEPEVAILGMHKISTQPVVRRQQIVPARVGYLSLTFDHRAVDGLAGGEFLQSLIRRVEAGRSEASRA